MSLVSTKNAILRVMSKESIIKLRVTETEKQTALAKAQAWGGLDLSKYIRVLLLLDTPPKRVTDVAWETFAKLGQTYNQLSRVGSNINQLSKIANSQGKVAPCLAQELEKLDKILTDLQSVVLEVRSQIDRNE